VPSPPIAARDERQRRFEEVYLAHRSSILGYVLRRTDNPDDAADVIAETFLTAWRRLEDVPCDVGARLWLYGVARRVLANHHRGVRRRSALTERLRADLSTGYRPPEFDSGQAQIAEAFLRLPPAERELLTLSAWEGLDYGQIAVVLGCSRNAVRLRLFRARKRFAGELASCQARSAHPAVNVTNGGLA
jgi:RNA polymerase sigma factor (sigma-70 family)